MSIVYVDIEHERAMQDRAGGVKHRARLDEARVRLASAARETCDVVRFDEVTIDTFRTSIPAAMVISGNTTDWSEYDFAELAGLEETIRAAPFPILGICGGHQLIGHAHGAAWGPLGQAPAGTIDPDPRFAAGMLKKRGFHEIDLVRPSPLFKELGESPVVFQSHYWQLNGVPAGFELCASSSDSPIQAIARHDRPVFGVQFHPERYDERRRDGELVLQNFFAIARSAQLTQSQAVSSHWTEQVRPLQVGAAFMDNPG